MPSKLRAARIPSFQSNRPSNWFLNLVAGATISLVLALVMVVTSVAVAEPPAHAGKDSEKCHPKKGCPVDDGDADIAEEPTSEPTLDPEPTSEPTQDPTTEPTQEPAPEPTEDPAPSSGTWSDQVVTTTSGEHINLVAGRLGSDATRTALIHRPRWSYNMWVRLVDHAAGVTGDTRLPDDGLGSWQYPRVTLDGSDLWTLSGIGPVALRQFRIGGSAAAPTLTQVAIHWYGDSDARLGDLTTLASGSVVAVWHERYGTNGTPVHGVALHRDNGTVTVREVHGLGPTASKEVVAQHPGDGSIWILNNNDASGSIGRIRLVERSSGLDVLSVDYGFIGTQHEAFGPDPENPRLAVAADTKTGDLVLAYQSAAREWSSSGIRSYPAVARMAANGGLSFLHLPVYVERVTPLGLTVRGGELWLTHRPLLSDGTFTKLVVAHLRNGTWSSTPLGIVADGYGPAPVDPQRPAIVYDGADGKLHWASLS